jgi:hypothetical protein
VKEKRRCKRTEAAQSISTPIDEPKCHATFRWIDVKKPG